MALPLLHHRQPIAPETSTQQFDAGDSACSQSQRGKLYMLFTFRAHLWCRQLALCSLKVWKALEAHL